MKTTASAPLASYCCICGDGYTPNASVTIAATQDDGEFKWAHKSCWVERKSKDHLAYESTQFYEGQFGFVSSTAHQHGSLKQREKIDEKHRFSAASIDWEEFILKLYEIVEYEVRSRSYQYELGSIFILGSLVNGEAIPGSDIDIIVGLNGDSLDAGSAYDTFHNRWDEFENILLDTISHPISEIHLLHVTTTKKAPVQSLSMQATPPTRQYYPAIIYDCILDTKWGTPRQAQNHQEQRKIWLENHIK